MRTIMWVSACIWAFALSASPTWSAPLSSDRYDARIRQAADTWLPGVPWRLYKAQLYQESRLDPTAVSPAGARGLAQFMPGTWVDMSRQLGLAGVTPHDAAPAITVGAAYMARLRRSWSSPRPEDDRHRLALASYNAGLGHILAAQRVCAKGPALPLLYEPIMACLPQITGRHARETLGYAPAIWRWWGMLEAMR